MIFLIGSGNRRTEGRHGEDLVSSGKLRGFHQVDDFYTILARQVRLTNSF